MKKLGAALALLVAGAALPVSCAKKPSVKLVLLDPCKSEGKTSFKDAANYTEITVFKNGCPPDSDLAAGLTLGNTDFPPAFDGVAAKGESLPSVGDLDKGKYGFAAVMRDANCGVIGFGCTSADLENIREVRVAVRAWAQPDKNKYCDPLDGKGCPAGRICTAGRCLAPNDGGADGGGGCDLTVKASGALPPLSVPDGGNLQLSGPTVAASTSGFVIGYRSQVNGQLYANAALLTMSGTINPPSTLSLAACPGKSPADGVGLAFSGGSGLMALSLPDCDTKGAGAYFMAVAPDGKLSALKLARSPGQFLDLTLARTHSLSGTGAADLYDFMYRATFPGPPPTTQMQLAPLQGNSFAGSISSKFGANAATFGMVASTTQIQALLGQVPSKASVEFDVGPPGAGSGDGGTEHTFLLPLSDWGAVTAWDDRAAAIAPGAGSGLTLQAATADGGDLGQITLQGDQFSSGDLTSLGDHLIVVGSEAQQLTLYRIDGAGGGVTPVPDAGSPPDTGTPAEAGPSDAGGGGMSEGGPTDSGTQPPPDSGSSTGALKMVSKLTLGINQLSLPDGGNTFDGHQVSIAAANGEVAVVWRAKLNPNASAPGGWALLQCGP